jgi:hypothetical protein
MACHSHSDLSTPVRVRVHLTAELSHVCARQHQRPRRSEERRREPATDGEATAMGFMGIRNYKYSPIRCQDVRLEDIMSS